MADSYHRKVAQFRNALSERGNASEAAEALRNLTDQIEPTPIEQDGKKTVATNFYGHKSVKATR